MTVKNLRGYLIFDYAPSRVLIPSESEYNEQRDQKHVDEETDRCCSRSSC